MGLEKETYIQLDRIEAKIDNYQQGINLILEKLQKQKQEKEESPIIKKMKAEGNLIEKTPRIKEKLDDD